MGWLLGINWQTTAAGIGQILGALMAIAASVVTGNPVAIATAVIGAIPNISGGVGLIAAKDKHVTGGTVPQTSEAAARTGTATPVTLMGQRGA